MLNIVNKPFTIYQLIPHKNLKNYNNEKLVRGFCNFSSRIYNRIEFKNKKIIINNEDFINYKMLLSKNNILFFISCPIDKKDYIKYKIESSWDHVTIKELEQYPFKLEYKDIVISEMVYKKHDIFSLKVDKDITFPLRSMFNLTTEMNDEEFVIIDVIGQPFKKHYWDYEANLAYDKFKNGFMPRKILNAKHDLMSYILLGVNYGFNTIDDIFKEMSGGRKEKKIVDNEVQLIMQQGLSNTTIQKINSEVLKTKIRIVCYGKRAKILNTAISGTYKEIATTENELENVIIESSKKNIDDIMNNRLPIFNFTYNKISTHEWSKLSMIATAELQNDFKQIQNVNRIETSLPDELFKEGMSFCEVAEKGITRIAKMPIHDHDILCMPHLAFGMMRTGKSEGFGNNIAYNFIMNGFSAFVLETNDGISLDMLRDSLPIDYPEEKIIEIDIGNLHYPISLSYNDSLSRSIGGDEVECAKVAEKLTAHIVNFINNLAHEPFSEKMSYYLNAGKAVLQNPKNGLLDMLLTLTSCSYREELMKEKYIREQPEIYEILNVLQQKSIGGTDASTIEPILTRLSLLIGNKFLANLFLQQTKLKNGKPVLDFRKYMDNEEGGYGYCVLLRIPKAEFTSNVVNIIASFVISKIWTCALSRIDIDKKKRKPFVFVADEPHQYIKGSGHLYEEAGVESGKYRMKLVWLAHSLGQFGEFKSALTDGGCQYTAYKTKTFKQFKELESEFKPHNITELYEDLPKRWVAVNKIYLPEADDVPGFIANMLPPKKYVKDRSYRKLECSKEFGRTFREVNEYINQTRNRRKLDEEWVLKMRNENKKSKKTTV